MYFQTGIQQNRAGPARRQSAGMVTIQSGMGSGTHKSWACSVTEILAYFWLTPINQHLPVILRPSVHHSSPQCKEMFSLITA